MQEDKEQAYRDGYRLGQQDVRYRRDWQCPYVTGSARWAMVRGYEQAWADKRQGRKENSNG